MRDQAKDRRINFQRETLLDLQDAVMQLSRAAGSVYHHHFAAHARTAEWHKEPLPDDLNESFRLSQVRTSVLAARVRDESVRQLVQVAKSEATAIAITDRGTESIRAFAGASATCDRLNDRIGELLREMDDESDSL